MTRPAAVSRAILRARALEARFGGLLEAAPDAMVIVDGDGRIVLINSAVETLFGFTRAELLGRPVEDLVPDRFRDGHPAHRDRYANDPRRRPMGAGIELFGRRKDGSEFPAEISLSPIKVGDERLTIAALRDVTARKKSETQFRGLLEAAPDAMVIVDRDGRIVLINGQAETLFGYSREELLGRPVEDLVPSRFHEGHPAHRTGYFLNPRPRPMGGGLALAGRRKDGSEFPVEISLSPVETEEGTLVTAAVRDVTEQKRLEEQVRQRNRELTEAGRELEEQYRRVQEASRLKSEFLANMSHELRTPLNAIIGFAELMHDGKVGPIEDQQREFLGDILTSSRHLLQLINDVLDLSKVESGKMEFRAETVDLGRLVGEVRDILRSLAASKRIPVEIAVAAPIAEVVTDSGKLKQILYNYLSNALKFTPDGGRVAIRLVPEDEEHFRLEVEDSGIGISVADQPRLFVEFQQLDASAAKKYPGTGLGLALTKRIVEAQGGSVGVRSTTGRGSTFFAVLPRRLRESSVEILPTQTAGGARVLVVEHDARDREWIARTLFEAGYSVESVSLGAEGIQRVREKRFDAITLALLLPDVGGRQVLSAIRASEHNRDTPVIVVTIVAEKDAVAGQQVHEILNKPVLAGDLIASLERAVVRRNGQTP